MSWKGFLLCYSNKCNEWKHRVVSTHRVISTHYDDVYHRFYFTVVVVRNLNLPPSMVLMKAMSLLASPFSSKEMLPVTPSMDTSFKASRMAVVSVEPAFSIALMATK